MKIKILVLGLLMLGCKNEVQATNKKDASILIETPKKHASKNAEIVFCLDATGSMGGLIGTAKEKIWDIVSELAQDGDIDTLKMGMVFYRDRGDDFITKQIAITTDLDEAYTELLKITAAGGGDSPESVNQGLHEAIMQMQWSKDSSSMSMVSLSLIGSTEPSTCTILSLSKQRNTCKIASVSLMLAKN